MLDRLPEDELYEPGEALRSYALREYATGVSPEGRFHPANILYHSFRSAGLESESAALCTATRSEFGRSGTAWGIKHQPGVDRAWELYYYQHADSSVPLSLLTAGRLVRLLDGWGLRTAAGAVAPMKRFSLSFDLDAAVLRGSAVAELHAYLDQGPMHPPSAVSYRIGPEGLDLENVYLLCRQDPPDLDVPRRWFYSSMFVDYDQTDEGEVFWPELVACDHIALAHKPRSEGVYFGGVTVDQLVTFLHRVDFEANVTRYVIEHKAELDHLRFDVGFDFVGRPGGGVRIVKSAIYGPL